MRFEPTTLTLASALMSSIYMILNVIYVIDKLINARTSVEHHRFTRQVRAKIS